VEGLPKDSFAILTKIHHAAIDGVSGAEIAAAIHDLEPNSLPAPPRKAWIAERDPTLLELAVRTTVNNVRQPLRFARVMSSAAPPAIRTALDRLWSPDAVRPAAPVPRTRFNGRVTPHRVMEGRNFSLDQVKQIRKQVGGATVNDVVLAVCSGALRRYLGHHGELPDEPLVAFAPISVRSDKERGTAGNQVSGMLVTLHTEVADPLERLKRIHEAAAGSKELSNAIGARSLTDMTQSMPGALMGLAGRVVARSGLMRRMNPIANCVVTNVPGPQVPLYMTEARMVANYGLGLPMDGLSLFHVVFSYAGGITISMTCCRETLPDPGFYAECLQESFDELARAAGVA
jgi:WS/DGAT/MGAT family acyltransferase